MKERIYYENYYKFKITRTNLITTKKELCTIIM